MYIDKEVRGKVHIRLNRHSHKMADEKGQQKETDNPEENLWYVGIR